MAVKLKKFDAINVVPFIDIMLVLLAMVLVMATFVAQGVIPVELPKAGASTQAPLKNHEIAIKPTGELFWDGSKVTPEELSSFVASGNTNDPILVRSDKQAAFEHFVVVMDTLKSNNYEKISIITENR